jgi:hypothetical protein
LGFARKVRKPTKVSCFIIAARSSEKSHAKPLLNSSYTAAPFILLKTRESITAYKLRPRKVNSLLQIQATIKW